MNLSIIIPAYKDELLQKTIDSVFEGAEKEIEIIAVLDGYQPEIPLKKDKRLKIVHLNKNQGMRGAINAGLSKAKGKFAMKLDAHCKIGKGFDKIMSENCAENWLIVPRRYTLNVEKWERGSDKKVKDYHFLVYPKTHNRGLVPLEWREMTQKRFNDPKFVIDDTMAIQGSCWFVNREYFMKKVGFLDDRPETYSTFAGDQIEIGLKYWLNGGEMKIIKNTWYAHLFKNMNFYKGQPEEMMAHKKRMEKKKHYQWATRHWMNNREPNMRYKIDWLIERFWPVPTWPEDKSKWRI